METRRHKGSKRPIQMKRLFLIPIFLLAAITVASSAENWPHWRGPSHNGVSDEINTPLKWTATQNIHWKLALPGRSGSTPIVWGDRIFLNVTERDRIELWS